MKDYFSIAAVTVFVYAISGEIHAQDTGSLPPTVGRNLNDQEINLPADLPLDPTLIVVTFDQNQQGDADRWISEIQKLAPHVPWMELAVIEPVNAFVRGMIRSGMRRGIPDSVRRAQFVTIFTPPADFAQKLGCSKVVKTVCVAVVNRSGHVREVASGGYNTDRASSLIEKFNP